MKTQNPIREYFAFLFLMLAGACGIGGMVLLIASILTTDDFQTSHLLMGWSFAAMVPMFALGVISAALD